MKRINGHSKPADMYAKVEDRAALKGQYIRHVDSGDVFKIHDVGLAGVTCYQAEGFLGPTGGQEFLITWSSLKYKHKILVHVADVKTKPGDLI